MKFKILILSLIFICSIGIVSASDNQTDMVADEGNYYTYTDLKQDIGNNNELNMSHDYIYDSKKDTNLTIDITQNLVINGNGHSIDGSGEANAFDVVDSNVSFNNLTFKNSHNYLIKFRRSNATFNNVTFTDNEAGYLAGVLFMITSDAVFNNCTFKLNPLSTGQFLNINSKVKIYDSFIYGNGTFSDALSPSNLLIENTLFENIFSKYATIYTEGSLTVRNSTFRNLHSNLSGGAIIVKDITKEGDKVLIENCIFDNVTSQKNAGAILIDASFKVGNRPISEITNSTFNNCSSDFGGAIVQLNGNLTITNSNFINNFATSYGGAIYTSLTNLNIINSTLCDNTANYQAGAIFFNNGTLNISNSRIINNKVINGLDDVANAIYNYECELNIENTLFNNSGLSIYGVYASNPRFANVTFGEDIVLMNNSLDVFAISNNGIAINLINNSIVVEDLPSKFDLRDWGWVSPVKNQGKNGACWAFGGTAAIESALLKATGTKYNISANNIQNLGIIYSTYGDTRNIEGGFTYTVLGYALSWQGLIPEEEDNYDEYGKISKISEIANRIHIQDAIIIMPDELNKTINQIKHAIMDYGAVEIGYAGDQGPPAYNEKNYTQYNDNENETSAHLVAVVGWDDNFSKDKFEITPPGDGAWIIKNSYGTDYADNGYFYMSYYDKSSLAIDRDSRGIMTGAVAYIIENTIPYTSNYQTDIMGLTDFIANYTYYANNFVSLKNELISAVGTYFNDGEIEYELKIYINDELVHTQNGVSEFAGYKTIVLNKYLPIKTGDAFKVEFKNNAVPSQFYSRQRIIPGVSYVSTDGKTWTDYANENKTVCLKVYMTDLPIYTQDLVKIYKNDSKFEANIGAANETVTFEIFGMSYNRFSDENGTAKISINLNPGNYTIKTTFNGTSVENNIEVLPTLIAKNLVKYFRNESQFYISLIDGEGNPVAGKNITMNINGVFYNRTTNENGTAKLNINLNPGDYILTATDPLTGLQMPYNITVLPTMNATDLEMIYKDGSTFNVTVVDGQGNPLANAAVTFNINGIFYTRYTNSEGLANLNINLMAGEYIITSKYDELQISNTIRIKD